MGIKTSHDAQTLNSKDELTIKGKGLAGYTEPSSVLYCGNSGTTMRLMLGVLAAQKFESTFTGDDSLNKRPMQRVFDPLQEMGTQFTEEMRDGERHIIVHPGDGVKGIDYHSPVASAQVKSSVMLAALCSSESVTITEPSRSRNHTELMLSSMGADVTVNGNSVTLDKVEKLNPINMTIPGDVSSAAFFIVAALIIPDSDLLIKNVNLNSTRAGLLDVLDQMGADIERINVRDVCGEAVGDLRVKSSELKNVSVSGEMIPRLIDEIPILSLAGVFAAGDMIVSDAKELRVKESDRIQAICETLLTLGVKIVEKDGGFVITGQSFNKNPGKVTLKSFGDHRMAMMAVVAGLSLDALIEIDDVACVNTSFPSFFQLIDSLRGQK